MTTIRIGNDIFVVWKVFSRNGMPFSLENQNIRIWLTSGPFKMEITDFTTSIRGEVAFKIDADSITRYGIYKLEMSLLDKDAETADATFDVTHIFQIVSTNYADTNNPALDDNVEIEPCSVLNNVITSTLEGASAYEIAVKHGYTGTEEEWLHDPVNGIMGNGVVSFELVGEFDPSPSADNLYRFTMDAGEIFEFLVKNGVGLVSMTSQESTADSGTSTYTMHFSDGTDKIIVVKNGKGVSSVVQTNISQENDGINVIRFTMSDGSITEVQVKNGSQGNSGYSGAAGELEVVNNLTEGGATAALSAEQGKVLDQKIGTLVDNNEYLRAITDGDGHLLCGIKRDGSIEWGAGIPTPVARSIDTKQDKEEGRSLIQKEVGDSMSAVDSPEYHTLELDRVGRILGGRLSSGERVENAGLKIGGGGSFGSENDMEGRLMLVLDRNNKIVAFRRADGTLYEPKIETESLVISGKSLNEIIEEIEASKGNSGEVPYNDFLSIGPRILRTYNPYKARRAHQFTGQLHCHTWTKFSDATHSGKFPYGYDPDYIITLSSEEREALLEQVAAEFVQRHKTLGYDFMTLSNYAIFEDVTHKPSVFPQDFLWLCDSYETTSSDRCHVIVWGAPDFAFPYGTGPFEQVKKNAQDLGCIVELPHPFDNEESSGEVVLGSIKSPLRFIEVYDGVSIRKYTPGGEMVNRELVVPGRMIDSSFDYLLTNGHFVFGTAISDERPAYGRTGSTITTENPAKNLKNGCVKVFADELTSEAIFDALMSGNFYASSDSDVNVNSIVVENGKYSIDTGQAGVVVEFLKENNTIVKTVNTSAGNTIAEYNITGNEKFVRARIYKLNNLPYDSNYWYKNKEWMIWTQPVFISKTIFN